MTPFVWQGRHVAITGASSGIGEALARELRAQGARLSLVARREDRLRALSQALGGAHVAVRDLAEADQATSWIDDAERVGGPIDVLVNNAGSELIGATAELDAVTGEHLLRLDLHAPLHLTRALLPGMIARGRGAIVDVTSVAALTPTRGYFWYAASKAGLAAASESLRSELAGTGVHVLTVYPGPIRTDMATRAEAQLEPSLFVRLAPYGSAATLARMIRRAVERGQPRVIYPRSYALSRWCPPLARWLADRVAPRPRR